MKKVLSLLLVLAMALALTACGGSGDSGSSSGSTPPPASSNDTSAPPADEGGSDDAAEPSFSGSYLMGTGSATGNYYQFGNAMCTVINNVTGANLTVNATGGSTENARLLG